MRIRIQGLDEIGEEAVMVRIIGKQDVVDEHKLEGRAQIELSLIPGSGVVLEAVEIKDPDPDAVILGDGLMIQDGGG
jgi:hypothetical protein